MKKTTFRSFVYGVFLFCGWLRFVLTGKNGTRAHQALVYFYCTTGGRFNQWCSAWISNRRQALPLQKRTGTLGDMSGANGQRAVAQLREKGHITFERALSDDACTRLMDFAMHTPARVRPMDGEMAAPQARMAQFDAAKPLAVRYDYRTADLLANSDVQMLMADASLLTIAEQYLGARPRVDVLSMWWHTNFHSQPDSEAAQFYHFDLDRIQWLKVFVYLTDVGADDGPHAFIEGSHAVDGIPQKFLERGYVRLSDDEVMDHYGLLRERRFVAPKGTIIVEDTRGLHKGNPVHGNSRLVLQLQFSNSLFGSVYPRSRLPAERVPELADLIARAPDVYSAFL